jgi:hypothetical protein
MIAAGWSDEDKPPAYRYAFLAAAVAHGAVVIWIAFGIESTISRTVVEGSPQLDFVSPWGMLLTITSFLIVAFAVHGTIQPRRDNRRISDFALGAALPSAILLLMLVLSGARMDSAQNLIIMGLLFCGLAIFLNRGAPLVLAGIVLIAFMAIFLEDARNGRIITQERSFFGVLRTREIADSDDPTVPPLRILMHGTTIHGAQLVGEQFSRLPLTYYHPRTALAKPL